MAPQDSFQALSVGMISLCQGLEELFEGGVIEFGHLIHVDSCLSESYVAAYSSIIHRSVPL